VHEGPMVSVLMTYQSLGGPDKISSQRESPTPRAMTAPPPGITNSLVHLSHIPATSNSHKGCPGRTPPARLAPKTRHRILSNRLNPYHTRQDLSSSLLSLPIPRHYVPYTYTPLTHQHHITNIMRVRVKAVICNMRASSLTAGYAGVRLQQGIRLKV
jgi:hypothetical protein